QGSAGGIVFQIVHKLPRAREAVRVIADRAALGQVVHPVGGEQAQRIPCPASPPLANAAALDNQMIDSVVTQASAEGKPRLPAANDRYIGPVHQFSPRLKIEEGG